MNAPVIDAYLDELLDVPAPPAARPAPVRAELRAVPGPMPVDAPIPASPHPVPMHTGAPRPEIPRAAPESPTPAVEAAPAAVQPRRWLRIAVDQDHYAVELLRVQEVVRTVPIMAMRGTPPALLGVMNLRGRIVPVFDLGRWLGAGEVQPDERARIVVVERDDELIGVLVSDVDDVFTLAADAIEPPMARVTGPAILGVARPGNAPTVLIDAGALFG